ncbi:hypothetical protein DOY81_002793 [Sarcophaga bullata]|nr:hypothetical protein DOY81_002793 [Sarcophaga bullata]
MHATITHGCMIKVVVAVYTKRNNNNNNKAYSGCKPKHLVQKVFHTF